MDDAEFLDRLDQRHGEFVALWPWLDYLLFQ